MISNALGWTIAIGVNLALTVVFTIVRQRSRGGRPRY